MASFSPLRPAATAGKGNNARARSAPARRAFVVGVGMTKFDKPGRQEDDYPDYAVRAGQRALADAQVDFSELQQAFAGYVYGPSCCGQRAVYELARSVGHELDGLPIMNVNSNCSTGANALYLARQAIAAGDDCVLAIGFERMAPGSLPIPDADRVNPLDKHMLAMFESNDEMGTAPPAPWMFGSAGREHQRKYGTTTEQIAKIAVKNHKHSTNNPYSQFQDEYTLEQVLASREIFAPLNKLACSPTSNGSAAVIVASEDFVISHGLQGQAVEIVGQALTTDTQSTFDSFSAIKQVGGDMTTLAANRAFDQAGITASDIDVLELHDCFASNELITYEALGLCGEGEAGACVDRNDFTYGGRVVVNPSGGLISKGHPLGATGLSQCCEMCWQLRGEAGPRQVDGATVAMSHNLGLGGSCVVTVYKRPANWVSEPMKRPVSGAMGFAEDGVPGGAVLPNTVRARL